eukprot:COSAG02_NODE_2261_length_9322_cov_152.037298_9_plen_136_part_00
MGCCKLQCVCQSESSSDTQSIVSLPDKNYSQQQRDRRIARRESSDRGSAAFLHCSVVEGSAENVAEATEGHQQAAFGAGCGPSRLSDVRAAERHPKPRADLNEIVCRREMEGVISLAVASGRLGRNDGTHEATME